MLRWRTIQQAYQYCKTADPETALTQYRIRQMVLTGVLHSQRVGTKYLISLEDLEAVMNAPFSAVSPDPGAVRKVAER
jgi:hypothetical protein